MDRIQKFIKKELVLVLAVLAAAVSMVFVPPSVNYITYIDFSVLGILFCLMVVVAGFLKTGLFDFLSEKLLSRFEDTKKISAILVLLCFFSAMLITNDVALLTFVPLTITILGALPPKQLIAVLVLESVAANLGSMLTPIGNPQNLYLYSFYSMEIGAFMRTVLPLGIFSLFLVFCGVLLLGNSKITSLTPKAATLDRRGLLLYLLLFALCILSVLRLLDYRLCVLITVAVLMVFERGLLLRVDYALLCTFVAFFIFVGNLGSIAPIRAALSVLTTGRELFMGIALSQLISNVPAAIMLSAFTTNAEALLMGVNIGGLGTLIASLASLICYKLYLKSENPKPGLFLLIFTVINVTALLCLTIFAIFAGQFSMFL